MSRLIVLAVIAFMCVSVLPGNADVGLGVKVGTPGLGIELTKDMTETLNVRAGANFFSLVMSTEEEEGQTASEIEAELSLMTVPLLLDWHPGSGGFRLSGGIVFNGNKLELTATPGDTVEIDDQEFRISRLDGEATFNSLAPYLGLGWGNASRKDSGRWHFSFDLGVMFQGAPDISISATAANPDRQSQLDAALESEIEEIEDDASVFNIYPVLAIGVSYTF